MYALLAAPLLFSSVSAHIALWHPSMFGFNVSSQQGYDNRPVVPLQNLKFDQWWYHNHLDYPPHAGDVFDLPAGQTVTTELACDKGNFCLLSSALSNTDVLQEQRASTLPRMAATSAKAIGPAQTSPPLNSTQPTKQTSRAVRWLSLRYPTRKM